MDQGQEEFQIGEVVVDWPAGDEVKETETMEFEEPPLDEEKEKEVEAPRLYIHKSIGAAEGDQKYQMVMKYVQN
jgi:hypothetical protein